MGYVDDHLLTTERVLHRAKLHWILFFTWRSLLTLTIWAWIERSGSEFAVTNRRVMMKVGLIWRRTLELNLSRIESIEVEQTFWGRLLGYGEIEVIGTGGTREKFDRIAAPLEFRKAVHEAGEALHTLRSEGGEGDPRHAPAQPPAERLEHAKALLDKGLISPEEYAQVRERLLREL